MKPFLSRDMRGPPALSGPALPPPVERRAALLVNPFYAKDPRTSFGKHVLTPSLALTTIAAATPPGWRVSIFDENLLAGPPPAAPAPEVAGITVHTAFAHRAYELADFYRRLGAKVVLGGLHVIACPEEAAARADAVAVGDGVALWPRILADVSAGRLAPRYDAPFTRPLADDPWPRRDLLPAGAFLTPLSLTATRGCRNRCGFCWLSTAGLRMPFSAREPADVAAEIAASGLPYAVFLDNNLGAHRPYLWLLCRALKPLRVIFSAAMSLDVTDDPRLVEALAEAGLTGVFIGFESLDDSNLAAARKRSPPAAEYARRVRIFHDHGIAVNGSFVFGFDDDGPDVFARTAAWVDDVRLACATYHLLTPYPGTPIFRQLLAEGRLLHRDWRLYDTAHVVFRPKLMTPEELAAGFSWCYRHTFSLRSILARRPADPRAVPAYLAMALLYKKTNRLWPALIRRRWVEAAWRPLVALSRHSHLRRRARAAAQTAMGSPALGVALP